MSFSGKVQHPVLQVSIWYCLSPLSGFTQYYSEICGLVALVPKIHFVSSRKSSAQKTKNVSVILTASDIG